MNQRRNQSLTIFLATLIISFSLFVFGVRIVLNHEIALKTVFAYAIASTIFAAIAAFFSRFHYRSGLWIYLSGLILGFASMIYSFGQDLSGWNDLVGIVMLFYMTVIGLAIAAIVLTIQVLWNRRKINQLKQTTIENDNQMKSESANKRKKEETKHGNQ